VTDKHQDDVPPSEADQPRSAGQGAAPKFRAQLGLDVLDSAAIRDAYAAVRLLRSPEFISRIAISQQPVPGLYAIKLMNDHTTPWLFTWLDTATVRSNGVLRAFQLQNLQWILAQTHGPLQMPLPKALESLFSDWRRRANETNPDQQVAASAYAAAVQVRETILSDPDSRPAVIEFGRTWLGFKSMPETRVEAVFEALLDTDWIKQSHTDHSEFLRRMRRMVGDQHELHRPITERQLAGWRIASLHEPVGFDADTAAPITVIDLVPGQETVEAAVLARCGGWADSRLDRVLTRLNDEERAVALAWADGDPDISWAAAAQRAGLVVSYGLRVQRKLQREGKRLTTLLAASAAMGGDR
jgi:hypothetical protein